MMTNNMEQMTEVSSINELILEIQKTGLFDKRVLLAPFLPFECGKANNRNVVVVRPREGVDYSLEDLEFLFNYEERPKFFEIIKRMFDQSKVFKVGEGSFVNEINITMLLLVEIQSILASFKQDVLH